MYSKQTNPALAIGNLSLGSIPLATSTTEIQAIDDTQMSVGTFIYYTDAAGSGAEAGWLYLTDAAVVVVPPDSYLTKSGNGAWVRAPFSPLGDLTVGDVTVTNGNFYIDRDAAAGSVGWLAAKTATAVAQNGEIFSINGQDAIAGTSVNGAANGGRVVINTGDAKRLVSGNGDGGDLEINLGEGIGTGVGGILNITAGETSGTMMLLKDSATAQRFLFDSSGFMSIGDPAGAAAGRPATAGAIRLPSTGLLEWRDAADTSNIFAAGSSAGTFYFVSIPGGVASWSISGVGVSSFENFSHSHGVSTTFKIRQALTRDYFTFDPATGYVAIGDPAGAAAGRPASTGTIRMASDQTIVFSNAANTGFCGRIRNYADRLSLESETNNGRISLTSSGEIVMEGYANPNPFVGYSWQFSGISVGNYDITIDTVYNRLSFGTGGLSHVGTSSVCLTYYAGSPENNVTAPTGSLCMDTTNGDLYIKTGGTNNTGWKLVTRAP